MATIGPVRFGKISTDSYFGDWYKLVPKFDYRYVERPPVPNKMYAEWLKKMGSKPPTIPEPFCCPLSHVEGPPAAFEVAEWVARTKVVEDGGTLHAWVAVSRTLFRPNNSVRNDQRLEEARALLVAAGADPSSIRDYAWEEGKAHEHGVDFVPPHFICHLIAKRVGETQPTQQPESWLRWNQRKMSA